jgi:putative aminopeptidase FrvX
MRDESLQFLQRLVNTPSPSGNELPGQRVWLDYARPLADSTRTDAYGNCVATFNTGGGPRIMLAAHADEIAMAVNYITKEGFIHVRRVGGVNPANVRSQRVTVHNRRGPVSGVFGNVAPHLTRGEDEKKEPKLHDLFLDIGASSREEALGLVAIGDPVTVNGDFALLRNDLAVARAFDNRIGTWAVIETLRLLKEEKGDPIHAEVCAVSNVQEEVGLLGARQVAYALNPALALVVDVTHATDYPTVDPRQHGEVKLGGGPALTHGGCNHPGMVARLEAAALSQGIPIQHEAMSNSSGTDTDVIFWTRGGIPSALISLPNRYMHSPVEIVSLKDLEMIPRLMAAFVRSLKPGESFGAAL